MTPQIKEEKAKHSVGNCQCNTVCCARRLSTKRCLHALSQLGQNRQRATDLHEANANDDLRQPIGYLIQIGVVMRHAAGRCSGTLHWLWNSEQEANDPIREKGGTRYCQGGREDAPPNCARNLRNVNQSTENAEETYGRNAQEPTKLNSLSRRFSSVEDLLMALLLNVALQPLSHVCPQQTIRFLRILPGLGNSRLITSTLETMMCVV